MIRIKHLITTAAHAHTLSGTYCEMFSLHLQTQEGKAVPCLKLIFRLIELVKKGFELGTSLNFIIKVFPLKLH